jgi:hypothetical protein
MFFGGGSIVGMGDDVNPTDDELLQALKVMAGPSKPLEDIQLTQADIDYAYNQLTGGQLTGDATDLVKLANSDPAAAARLAQSIANNITSTPAQAAQLAAYNATIQRVYQMGQQTGATAGPVDKLAASLGIPSSTLIWGAVGTVAAIAVISAISAKKGR